MGFLDYLSSSAVSLTVSGNTGISPFLTLLLLGIIEKSDPELLNMDGFIEKILSSWVGICVLGVLTGLEFLGKCIPVIDEILDSIEILVVPIFSILASLGTMGLLDLAQESTDGRRLNAGDSMLMFFKVVLVIAGVGLALAVHLFKMLIRMVGLTCCAGCCQPCITVVEVTCVLVGVLVSILIQEIAIATCIILCITAGYAIKRKFVDKNMPESISRRNGPGTARAPTPNNGNTPVGQNANNNDVEVGSNVPPAAPKKSSNEFSPISSEPPSINPAYVKVECDPSQDGAVVEAEAIPVR